MEYSSWATTHSLCFYLVHPKAHKERDGEKELEANFSNTVNERYHC